MIRTKGVSLMTHDAMCPDGGPVLPGCICQHCDLIARVRVDERDNGWGNILGKYRDSIKDELLKQLREQVKALHGKAPSTYWDDALDEVIDLLGGECSE